jgi:hypothetical protein
MRIASLAGCLLHAYVCDPGGGLFIRRMNLPDPAPMARHIAAG